MDKDYFGNQAQKYKQNRPVYSPVLIEKIKDKLDSLGSKCQRMLDIATGSGQLAIGLASKFEQVYGLDISEKQILVASEREDKPPNVKFQVFDCAEIEKFSELNDIVSYDVIACGQCLHWFEPHKILSSIKSALTKDTGLFVVLSYVKFNYEAKNWTGQQIIDLLQLYRQKVWPYFIFKSEELEGYPSYPFEEYFSQVEKQSIEIPMEYSIDNVVKHMCTWSGVQNYNEKEKKNFNEGLRKQITAVVPQGEEDILEEPSYFCKVSMNFSLIFAYH